MYTILHFHISAPNTASLREFWRMIWQEHVETIVMVTNLFEGGKVKTQKAIDEKLLCLAIEA